MDLVLFLAAVVVLAAAVAWWQRRPRRPTLVLPPARESRDREAAAGDPLPPWLHQHPGDSGHAPPPGGGDPSWPHGGSSPAPGSPASRSIAGFSRTA